MQFTPQCHAPSLHNFFHFMTSRLTLPTDMVLGTTYRCNSRCTMCDIWKKPTHPDDELTLDDLRKLPSSLKDINISGGEPFLRADLTEIVRVLKEQCPSARLLITTNGFLTDLIEKRMREILAIAPEIAVRISVDGVGDMHEKIRRIPQAFEKDMETLRCLKELGVRDLGLAFTATPENVTHLSKVYDLTQKLEVEFTCAVAQSSEFYFSKMNNERPEPITLAREFRHVIRKELSTWSVKRWLRAYFAYGLMTFSTTGRPVFPTAPAHDFFYLDPTGFVYPSVVDNIFLGNLKKVARFHDLWFSPQATSAREKLAEQQQAAWMICTARTAMRENPFRVMSWIAKEKFFSEAGEI